MKELRKFGVYALLGMALTFSAASCCDEDPEYDDVIAPEVAVTHNISGRVTSMNGEGIQATVSLNGSAASTTADGTFTFENVATGSYTLKAEADGKVSKETTLTVDDGDNMNPVWNVALSNEGVTITVKDDGSAEGNTATETLRGNEEAEIPMVLTAPAGAVEAGAQIIATPAYSTDEAEQITGSRATGSYGTRADGRTFLTGTNVRCSNASATLLQPITLEYNIDPDMAGTVVAQKYVDGQWVDAEFSVDGEKVTVKADRFTSYSLFCTATLSYSNTSEAISFTPNSWDNLYGSGSMSVSSASYSYKIGTDISLSKADKVTSYLIELVARAAGAGLATASGTYPINVTLPVGTAMSISGKQNVTNITASALGRSASGKQYGTVSVTTKTWNRQHTGGGSR